MKLLFYIILLIGFSFGANAQDLLITISGDGSSSTPYTVNVKSNSASTEEAGAISFFVYFNSANATFSSFDDSEVSGSSGFNWGTFFRTATVQSGTYTANGKSFNRRFYYDNLDFGGINQSWPANSSSGIDILLLEFNPNGGDAFFEVNGSDGFSDWSATALSTTISGAATPLPVELISFNVSKEANDAMLEWATASEKDNSHFEVERSIDGRDWATVGNVRGNGTSTARHQYTFTDDDVYNGRGTQTFYYRLRQVDYNGDHEYSDVRVVTFTGEGRVAVFSLSPNPTTDRVQVNITGYSGRFTATFFDGNGRQAGIFNGSGSQLTIPVSNMRGGTYSVRITTATGELLGMQRLVVVR